MPTDPATPLMLLPGTLCDTRLFGPMLAAMEGLIPPILHGTMTGLPSANALALRLLASAPPRFVPIGFSLGAIVALEIARIAPHRIAAMALIAANARPVPVVDHPVRLAAASADPVDFVDALWPRSVAPARAGDPALRALVRDMARAAPADTLALQTQVALTRADQRPHLPAMRAPTLVLGGAQDLIAPPQLQRELAAALPHATLHIAPGAGHFLPLECPDFCARALSQWLAQGPA